MGTKPTVRIRTDRTRVRSHPLRDGIHDKGLDLETFLTYGEPRPPTIGVVVLSLMKRLGEQRPWAATYYGYDALGNLETTTKTMTDATLHRTADELSPSLQCCHG